MERALQELGATAWLSGLRRTQSEDRGKRPFIEKQFFNIYLGKNRKSLK